MKGWRSIPPSRSATGRSMLIRGDGARIERTTRGDWRGWDAAGEPYRVSSNSDGSTYVPAPWHTNQDKPIVRMFPSASFAALTIDRKDPQA